MRILVLFSGRLLESRGTPSRGRNLVRALAAQPDNEILVLSGDPAGSLEEPLGVAHEPVGPATLAARLATASGRFRPEILFGQTSKAVPHLARTRIGRGLKVVDVHGDLAVERWEQRWRPLARRLVGFTRSKLEEHRFFPAMHAFTAVSEVLAARVRRWGAPVEVVWGGVDPELFRAPEPESGDGVTVAYAGNFLPYQGLDVLVEALARLDASYRLLLVGDRTGGESLLDRARRALGDRLTVLDPVPYSEIPGVLGAADVLVVPRPMSRTARFGFPSKLPEYLALGRPVVVTDVGDQGRVVGHGESGLVVPSGSVSALTEALSSLADEGLRRRLGRAGRALAEGRLSWSRIGLQLQSFFDRLIGGAVEGAEVAGPPVTSRG